MTELQKTAHDLLKLFGPNGEHWIWGMLHTPGYESNPQEGQHCLLGGLEVLSKRQTQANDFGRLVPDKYKRSGFRDIPLCNVPIFNDNNRWPVIKAWLLSIARGELKLEGEQ